VTLGIVCLSFLWFFFLWEGNWKELFLRDVDLTELCFHTIYLNYILVLHLTTNINFLYLTKRNSDLDFIQNHFFLHRVSSLMRAINLSLLTKFLFLMTLHLLSPKKFTFFFLHILLYRFFILSRIFINKQHHIEQGKQSCSEGQFQV